MPSRVRRFGVEDAPVTPRPNVRLTGRRPQGPVPKVPQNREPLRSRPAAVILVGILTVVVGVSTIAASNRSAPAITANPPTAAAGAKVMISGTNFPRRSRVQLLWNGTPGPMPAVTTNASGRLTAEITVPNVAAGRYAVGATTAVGTITKALRGATTDTVAASVQVTVIDVAEPTSEPTTTNPDPTSATGGTPTLGPTNAPSLDPTPDPTTVDPTLDPTAAPTPAPTATFGPPATIGPSPTPRPTATATPTPTPTPHPTATPTPRPTATPTPRPTATPTQPPAGGGIPDIPAGRGDLFRKDFSDGSLGPFVRETFNNDHPGQLMTEYCDYSSDSAHISVHDGYLDLRATRKSGGRWDCALVGTFVNDGSPPSRTFDFQYGSVRAMVRMSTGQGAWHGFWLWSPWGSPEIDWPELIGGRITANLHGSSADGQKESASPPGGWHEYGIDKRPGYIAFFLDGVEVARTNVSMSARMTLLADCKVGLDAPSSSTPNQYFQVAWVTVDP